MNIKKTWDKIFREEEVISQPQEDMPKITKTFKEHGVKKVLDLGCGSGKHTVYLADQGFEVYGIDISTEGLKKTRERLKERGLRAILTFGSIYKRLPYPDNFFNAIICIRTINHARIESIRRAIKEIKRILKPEGFLFVTTRRKREKEKRLLFKVIAPHTYIPLEGREKGIVHYLFTKKSLQEAFRSFKTEIWLDETKDYYCLLGTLKEPKEKSPSLKLSSSQRKEMK